MKKLITLNSGQLAEGVVVIGLDGAPASVGGGGGSGGAGSDRELVVSTYRATSAFTGASIGDIITATQILDVTSTATHVATIWRNQTTASDLAGAPSLANLELAGAVTLTNAQLRASPVPVSGTVAVSGTVPVSGTVAVSGTVPVSGNVGITGGVAVSGPVTDTQLRATALPVSGVVSAKNQDGAGTAIDSLSAGTGANGLMMALGATNFSLSAVNSSVAQLAAGATFTGGIETIYNAQDISVLLTADQAGTLTLNQYIDLGGTRKISAWSYPIAAGVPFSRSFVGNGNYFNLVYQNTGGSTTTTLNINTAYGTLGKATNLGNAPVSLNEVNGLALSLGAAAVASSLPVNMANSVTATGGSLASPAVNMELMTATSNGWYDAANFRSVALQIQTGAGISGGLIAFEQTNDTTVSAAGNALMVIDPTNLALNPVNGLTLVASTSRIFYAPLVARYFRIRVSTAVTGGNVQAVAVLSQMPLSLTSLNVQQGSPSNFSMTASIASSQSILANPPLPTAVADLSSAAVTTTTTTSAVTPGWGASYSVNVPITAVSGTTPTLDFSIEESDDGGTNWYRVYDFPRITATGIYRSPKIVLTGNRIRYVQTISGTTPSFTRAINRMQLSDMAMTSMRQIIDRTLAPNTLNSVTPSLAIPNIKNVQLVINTGAITTTANAVQMEGSDDNGATWYAIGAPLTAVASSTVSLLVTIMQCQLLRARVSTAGVGVTAGYVLIKGF